MLVIIFHPILPLSTTLYGFFATPASLLVSIADTWLRRIYTSRNIWIAYKFLEFLHMFLILTYHKPWKALELTLLFLVLFCYCRCAKLNMNCVNYAMIRYLHSKYFYWLKLYFTIYCFSLIETLNKYSLKCSLRTLN